MRFARFVLLALLALLALPAAAQEKPKLPTIAVEEFRARRAALMARLPDGVLLIEADPLLKGEAGIDGNTPRYDYAYLAGYHHEGDVLALVPATKSSLLFAREPDGLQARSGVDEVLPAARFEDFLRDVVSASPVVYSRLRQSWKDRLEELAPKAEVRSGGRYIPIELTRLRVVKSDAEMAMIRHASVSTCKAHLAAMRACKAGMNEGALQKVIEDVFKAEGCDGLAFPSIVGSGKNGTILHYMENKVEMPADTLVVCDIGASHRGYATDITRTLPTSGKFSKEHREAYETVLASQRAAEEVLKPGATFRDLEAAARKVFEDRDKTDWSYAHSTKGGPRHGLGHFVGLSVHDSGEYGRPLAPGHVITIEPGYYNREGGYGIRIEDMYLVTKDGFERLSASAPREVDEIEKLMAGK